jgi:hypothetical protein
LGKAENDRGNGLALSAVWKDRSVWFGDPAWWDRFMVWLLRVERQTLDSVTHLAWAGVTMMKSGVKPGAAPGAWAAAFTATNRSPTVTLFWSRLAAFVREVYPEHAEAVPYPMPRLNSTIPEGALFSPWVEDAVMALVKALGSPKRVADLRCGSIRCAERQGPHRWGWHASRLAVPLGSARVTEVAATHGVVAEAYTIICRSWTGLRIPGLHLMGPDEGLSEYPFIGTPRVPDPDAPLLTVYPGSGIGFNPRSLSRVIQALR